MLRPKPCRGAPVPVRLCLLYTLGVLQIGFWTSPHLVAQDSSAAPLSPAKSLQPSAPDYISVTQPPELDAGGKADYYTHRILNPATILGPAAEAGFVMAAPPKAYPREWHLGAAAYWRNYGSALARQQTGEFGRFVAGVALREDPRYYSSTRTPVFARIAHALGFTFVDRSDSGNPRLAFANLLGAAAGGFVGDAYLPTGYTDLRHSSVRTGVQLGAFGASNLVDEFRPELNKLKQLLHHSQRN
jgi:hypothetical protein